MSRKFNLRAAENNSQKNQGHLCESQCSSTVIYSYWEAKTKMSHKKNNELIMGFLH